jgi:N-acetylmuramoyl-L-alanine amidase
MKKCLALFLLLPVLFSCSCATRSNYTGNLKPGDYPWLRDKRIFLDPGHGGAGKSDRFRVAPNGLTEEEINLNVSLILRDMLKSAGAVVCMSREKDMKVSLQDRVQAVHEFKPDIFISMHHNGSPRRDDGVNYPLVLIWGNPLIRPESYEFAGLLLEGFENIMKTKGFIISDQSLFTENGSMVLRETRGDCPGVIGEAGFYSDAAFAEKLKDKDYLQQEAEAYFLALSGYFKTGLPSAKVVLYRYSAGKVFGEAARRIPRPVIEISADPGIKDAGVDQGSFTATLDGLPVRLKPFRDNRFLVDYGRAVYPGDHELRFHFRNTLGRSSMFYTGCFSIPAGKGDCARLINEGLALINKNGRDNITEGLKMLLSEYSLTITDPGADQTAWNIARAFGLLGDTSSADYYYYLIRECYPGSKYYSELRKYDRGDKIIADYKGKVIYARYEQ